MKTYEQIVQRLANDEYSRWMQGAFFTDFTPDELIVWAFGFDKKQMAKDIEAAFKKLLNKK